MFMSSGIMYLVGLSLNKADSFFAYHSFKMSKFRLRYVMQFSDNSIKFKYELLMQK